MFYERVANGKQCPKNTEQPAASTNIFKNGHRQDFLKESGPKVWKNMMSWNGIGWEWQSLDGCMVKAPLALEAVGKNPTDRGKNGDKTQCTDG